MLILGLDTSGKSGGATLAEGNDQSFRVIESSPITGGTFSAQLVPTVAAILKNHGYSAHDLDGFAVASGPGSFTGLRVGLSAVKGLAEVLQKPIVTVSLLEAIALRGNQDGRVAAALDAGRSEVFFGLYDVREGSAKVAEEKLLSQNEFMERLRAPGIFAWFSSDLLLAELASAANIKVEIVERPGSASIAQIGLGKLLAGHTVLSEALDANYLRRSDAEIFFKGNR